MASLLGFVGIILGTCLALSGLLMIAPQVRVHQIEVYSIRSWVYRLGMVLTLLGLILGVDGHPEVGQVGLITGIAGVMGGIITLNHERKQAHDRDEKPWHWAKSLTLQMIGLALPVVIIGLA